MPRYEKEISVKGKSQAELYKKISKEIEDLLKRFRMDSSLNYERLDAEHAFQVKHQHFTARLEVLDGKIILAGELSWIASAFRGRIDSGIEQWVKENLS